MAMFGSPAELGNKIRYYLEHEMERARCRAARARDADPFVEGQGRVHHGSRRRGNSGASAWAAVVQTTCRVARCRILVWVCRLLHRSGEDAQPAQGRNASSTRGLWLQQQVVREELARRAYGQGFNVSMCELYCRRWPHFALTCGGFLCGAETFTLAVAAFVEIASPLRTQ